MEFSDIVNWACVKVKEERRDGPLSENNREVIDEKPDLQNFQLLPSLRENSNYTFRKCDVNHKNELDGEVEIVVECEDVKLNINLLTVEKFDDNFSNYLQDMKYNQDYETQNIIKMKTTEKVQQEFFRDVVESNVNNACKITEQIKERKITKKRNDEHNLKTNVGATMQNNTFHTCDTCGKNCSTKGTLDRHVKSLHHCITHSCDLCVKSYATKRSLKNHIDKAHHGIAHTCNICTKTFKQKCYLKIHIRYIMVSDMHAIHAERSFHGRLN
ncbi:transcriptional repressor CTCF-like [Trichogramma pretiosum]|uniref:transcriptional repressor CTCF-like n=1 Tax=Trichogramma pretiosum TaxID=7493 RepID=UPI000C71ABC8|nr:transcriptional repressor CTCF-like [Trichogramma pretiosum]